MASERIHYLVEKLLDQSLSEQEREAILDYLQEIDDLGLEQLLEEAWHRQGSANKMPEEVSQQILATIFAETKEMDRQPPAVAPRRLYRFRMTAAAALILLVATATFFLVREQQSPVVVHHTPAVQRAASQLPGKNTAILTLADGRQISLNDASKGLLATDGKSAVTKLSDGRISYQASDGAASVASFNTLKTPPGNMYEVTLPDGSSVWLNAVSSIRFPTAFREKERRVQVTGEAYFEVKRLYAQDGKNKVPFIVEIKTAGGNSEVQVLGTHFNVKAYDDEAAIKTSLLEGSVKIFHENTNSLLRPGEQAQAKKGGGVKIVQDVKMNEVMAWKNGFFQYDHADLQTVLHDAARWYDLEVEFAGEVPTDVFTGRIERSVSLARLLKWVQWSDVSVRLEGRKMIVE